MKNQLLPQTPVLRLPGGTSKIQVPHQEDGDPFNSRQRRQAEPTVIPSRAASVLARLIPSRANPLIWLIALV